MKAARKLWIAGFLLAAISARGAVGQVMPDPRTATGTLPTPSGVATSTASTGQAAVEPVAASPWSWIRMPRITMPKIEMPKMPADPLKPVKVSARKVSDGTKKAWEGTKELFTFGAKTEQPTERLASRPEQPSVWKRMFGGAEEEPQTPQTVADWMAQPRVE